MLQVLVVPSIFRRWCRPVAEVDAEPENARHTGRPLVVSPVFRSLGRPIWTPWGWAVDRKRLTWLTVNWCFRNRKCFTCQFRSQYRRTRREVFPILSRIQNIGYEMGENGRTPEWYRANHRTPWVAKTTQQREQWRLA